MRQRPPPFTVRMIGKLSLALAVSGLLSACGTAGTARGDAPHRSVDAELAAYAAMPNGPGTGAYPAIMEAYPSLPDHVVYRPADLGALKGEKLPVIVWGNGGCSDDGASARLHLLEIASHEYLVIAAGRILSGPGASGARETVAQPAADGTLPDAATTASDLLAGIDWAIAENGRADSRFYHDIDTRQIAASGRSCGGLLALRVAADPRVRAVVLHNSGTFPVGAKLMVGGVDGSRALLGGLHTPILYVMGGPTDIAYQNALDDFAALASRPVVLASQDVGHGGTFRQPNGGEGARVAVAWFDWQLKGSAEAGRMFTGPDCGLCNEPGWSVMRSNLAAPPN